MGGALRLAVVSALTVALAGCASRAVQAESGPPPAPVELWVDASALEGGDGTEARPLKTLGAALESARAVGAAHVHVRTGLYRGPFTLPAGWAIDGPESAVLFVEGAEGQVLSAAD